MHDVASHILCCYNIEHFIHIVKNPIALCGTVVVLISSNEMFDL